MRKLALLLGSLVVVASASAKEVVPAPVVVEEAPVQIVEKEVIVYRDKEEGFKPNGYVDVRYQFWGETEGQNEKDTDTDNGSWNGNNNYGRLQLEGKIQMTEKAAFDYRVRNYDSLTTVDGHDKDDEERLRFWYNHGNLGDSKVNFTSKVEYKENAKHNLEYMARFDFAEYMFNNDFIKTTAMVVGPYYRYTWSEGSGDDYDNNIGLYGLFENELPFGFGFVTEVDTLGFHNYGDKTHGVYDGVDLKADPEAKKNSDSNTDLAVNVYLTYGANLYSNDKVSVDFWAESGFDSYGWSDKVAKDADHSTYELKTDPQVTVTYKATEFVSLYATAGAEYRNWARTNQRSASNWRWQPFAIVGFKTTF